VLASFEGAGTVEFTVEGDHPITYTFRLPGTGAQIEEREATSPDAGARGSQEAWIAAFAPERDRTALELTGDSALAVRLLDALAGASARASHSTRVAAA
jgi:hypothetical protein